MAIAIDCYIVACLSDDVCHVHQKWFPDLKMSVSKSPPLEREDNAQVNNPRFMYNTSCWMVYNDNDRLDTYGTSSTDEGFKAGGGSK